MWTIVTTALRSLWSKAGAWALAALAIVVGLLTISTYLINSGKTTERLTTTQKSLEELAKAKRIEAEIDALSAAAARERLRDRWGRR